MPEIRSHHLLIVTALLLAPPMAVGQSIAHERISVAATNDEWTATTIAVDPGDIILILAAGRIRVGQFIGETGPGGTTTGEGTLQLKIGVGAGQRVGERAFLVADQPGQVKLRVNDTRYSDNAGAFEVSVIYIPAAAIPAAALGSTPSSYPSAVAPYLASVKSDLRNLVTAQEAYFADSVRYAATPAALRYTTTRGVTISELRLSKDGWSAYATHATTPGWICAIYVGTGPAPSRGQREGEPVCWQ